MNSCNTNISPIFGVYDNADSKIEKIINQFIDSNDPIIEAQSLDGITNKIWKIDNKNILSEITSYFEPKEILIADGHHRYETSLNYSKENKNNEAGYVMFYLTGTIQDGLLINPTHRILNETKNSKEITSSVLENFKTENWSGEMNEDLLVTDEFFYIDKKNNVVLKCKIRENDIPNFEYMSVYAVQEKIIDAYKESYSSLENYKSL